MILWCFPGLGKSFVSKQYSFVLDLDCVRYQFRGLSDVKDEDLHGEHHQYFEASFDYPQTYLNDILRSDGPGQYILINCEPYLLEQLHDVVMIYPDCSLKEEYLNRYRSRGDNDSFIQHMDCEFENMVSYLERMEGVRKLKVKKNIYLKDIFEGGIYMSKIMSRQELTAKLQKAMDLGVIDTEFHTDGPSRLICDAKFATQNKEHRLNKADVWAEAVLDGKYELDIDELERACKVIEAQKEEEERLFNLRGGLSREELEAKIMQGIVNGALGIRYGMIAPYSHGYEVTFGGDGPVGSTRSMRNRWECYVDFWDIPHKIVQMIENDKQSNVVFGAECKDLHIDELLAAIEQREDERITSFTPEKDTNFSRRIGYGRGDVASVVDVHSGKGLDGIVKHHYQGDYSSMTPVKQNTLVERLVYLNGFCLDYLPGIGNGMSLKDKEHIYSYLKKNGISVETPEKMDKWILENPEKCALEENRMPGLESQIKRANMKRSFKDNSDNIRSGMEDREQ